MNTTRIEKRILGMMSHDIRLLGMEARPALGWLRLMMSILEFGHNGTLTMRGPLEPDLDYVAGHRLFVARDELCAWLTEYARVGLIEIENDNDVISLPEELMRLCR